MRRPGTPLLATLLLLGGCAGLRSSYEAEVRREQAGHAGGAGAVLTESDIEGLPAPVRRHLRACGHVGRPVMSRAEVVWSESAIRMDADGKWLTLETHQFNAVPEPMRAAYMRARLFGLLPFEGHDLYRDGYGSMRIVLLRALTVGDDRGPEMNQSALVTVLAETFLVPSYALAPYITWDPIDERSARATIRHRDVVASGVFEFNNAGEFARFRTEDRYYSEGGGRYRLVPWSAEVLTYVEADGVKRPSRMRAVWHREDGDFEYFRGTIEAIVYDPGPTTTRSP